ncbi:MAG: hypothetical protein CME02_03145 [Geminicoccus sp.]|nr:hypothetical protein [Geminicoccus sp.]
MITRGRFHAALVAVFLAALAPALLGLAGTAAAEPRLDRILATEQSLTRKIEQAERRLRREQKKLARAASDLERRCAGQSIDRERRMRCANLSESLEQNRESLDRDAEKLARHQERLAKLSAKIALQHKRTERQQEKLSKRLARAEARVSKAEQQIATIWAFIDSQAGSEAARRAKKVEEYRARLAKSERMHQRWTEKRYEYRTAPEALGDG